MTQRQLAIDGMTCASCVARVERALRKVPGVQDVSVNLATEQAVVELAGGAAEEAAQDLAATDSALCEAVHRAGYEASVLTPLAPDPVRREHDPGWRVALAGALSAPLMLPMLAERSPSKRV